MPWCDDGDDGVTMVFYFIVTAKTLVKSGFSACCDDGDDTFL